MKQEKSFQQPVNSVVDQDHTGHRKPEGQEGGEDCKGDVRVEDALGNTVHLLHLRPTWPVGGERVNLHLYHLHHIILGVSLNYIKNMKTDHPSRIGTKEMRQGQNHAAAIIAVTDLTLKLNDIVEGRQRRKFFRKWFGPGSWENRERKCLRRENCESCPTQVTWKVKFMCLSCQSSLTCLSRISWLSCLTCLS